MFKAVIFDMDGLMFDTERLNAEAWLSVGPENGVPMTREIIMKVVGHGPEGTSRIFRSHFPDMPDYYELRRKRIQHVNNHIARHGMPVKRGLRELLAFLKRHGYKVALATSTPKALASTYVEMTGLTGYFHQMVFGDMIQRAKPAPDIYLKACELLGEAPADCLTLEDSTVGVKAAWLAGTKPVMVPDMVGPDEDTRPMLYALVESLLDVIPLLEQDRSAAEKP